MPLANSRSVCLLLALTCAASIPASAQETNLLALANGTLPVVEPATYGGGWTVINLIDEASASGWAGAEGSVGGQAFVFEMTTAATIERFEFGTECLDGSGGRGAKGVRVS